MVVKEDEVGVLLVGGAKNKDGKKSLSSLFFSSKPGPEVEVEVEFGATPEPEIEVGPELDFWTDPGPTPVPAEPLK